MVVEHRAHLAAVGTGDERITDLEGTGLNEHSGDDTFTAVEFRFNDHTAGQPVGIGFEIEHFGFQQHIIEEKLHILPGFGRNFDALVLAAPLFDQHIML